MKKDELIAKQKELIQALTEYSTHVVIMWNKDLSDDGSKDLKLRLWNKVKELRSEISALEADIEQEPVTESVKTAEEILSKIAQHPLEYLKRNFITLNDALVSMEEYASQFRTESVKMPSEEEIDKVIRTIIEKSIDEYGSADTEAIKFYSRGFKVGAKWLKSQVKTIDLRGELLKYENWLLKRQGFRERKDSKDINEYLNSKQ